MRSPVPPLISLINSERPPFDLYLNAGTFFRGSKKASAPATGASDLCAFINDESTDDSRMMCRCVVKTKFAL